tara:strand:+ start:297 stop:746 length:450 start_codon:yes stop_codon:yes gene_type:complete
MSELVTRIKKDIMLARKAGQKQKVKLLSLVVGEVDTMKYSSGFNGEVTDDTVAKILKKIIKANQETISACGPNDDLKFAELVRENKLFESYLPDEWTKEQIEEVVHGLQLPDGNIGNAIGVAVKHFKTVDGIQSAKLISEVVRERYGTS